MAKMKIYEIVSSMQRQFPDLQNKDVVTLLQENGFDVKNSQSTIEDDAIGFLLKHASKAAVEKKNDSANNKEHIKKSETVKKTTEEKIENKPEKEKPEIKEEVKKAETKEVETKIKNEAETEKEAKKADVETKETKEVKEKTVEEEKETQKVQEKEEDGKEETVKAEEKIEVVKTEENKEVKKDIVAKSVSDDKKDIKRHEEKQEENKDNKKNGNRDNRNRANRDNRNGGSRDNRNSGNRDNKNGGNRDNKNSGNRDSRNGGNRDNKNGGNRDNRNGGNRDNRNRSQGGFSRGSSMPMDSMKSEVKQSRQQRANKDSRSAKQKYGKDRGRGMDDDEMFEQSRKNKKKDPNRKGAFIKPEPVAKPQEPEDGIRTITLPEKMTIKELSDIMKVTPSTVIKNLFMRGQVVTLNHEITFEEAEEIALEYNCIAEMEEKVDMIAEILKEDEEDESLMVKRPPVVCVMGHVDHGKTSLLDAIRETSVTSREAGGITQHIGAYVTEINGEKITFLDTPGHEAFTSMRMRGAQSTDIAILVVAADDGVMPQTVEAISHAKAAGVEIIVAVNKIDKPSANVERVKQELTEHGLIAEDWGGDTVFVPVSAHTKEGIDQLLEMIILTAEVLELKANPDRKARGVVIEAQLDKGRGPVATVLVQKGTLHVGDNIAVGAAYGKIRAMMDDQGRRVKTALPSTPVEILGLHDVPDAGEIFMATDSDKEARNIAEVYIEQGREKLLDDTKSKLTLDGLFSQIQAGNIKELNLIVKADVQGSVEAVKQSLLKLSNDEVAVRIIHGAVGAINESDVSLASASNAIIIGFNVRPDNTAKEIADREKVDVRLYRVIYNAIEDIESAMKGMLDPEYEEKVIGHAEVRQTFKASGVGMIAGSYVLDGKIERNCKVRISREGEQIFEGELASLKRFQDDVKEVATGYECGLVFEGFNDIKEEDQIEAYI
ncbi:translation initiation factor IF-2, partial [Butyribacter sp.]|uniref:translation initiation factor IF-2 n=1 Tax=Butyribacter sp. TaxID=2822465 RepID=UPI002A9C9079|nr:translation initiation factor IF-2 [Butyribacter sp.]